MIKDDTNTIAPIGVIDEMTETDMKIIPGFTISPIFMLAFHHRLRHIS